MYLNLSFLHLLAVTSHYAAPNLFSQPIALTSLARPLLLPRTLDVTCPCSCLYCTRAIHLFTTLTVDKHP